MAIGPQILGHGAFNYSVKYLPAAWLGLLSLLEPVGASILAYVLFREVPPLLSLLGMMLVLGAVGFAVRYEQLQLRRQLSLPT
jgi:drug/metabolite transporter (DMT)-like permease